MRLISLENEQYVELFENGDLEFEAETDCNHRRISLIRITRNDLIKLMAEVLKLP